MFARDGGCATCVRYGHALTVHVNCASLHSSLVSEGMTTPEKHPQPATPAAPDAPGDHEPASPSPKEASTEPRVIGAGRPRVVEADVRRDRGWDAVVRIVLERGDTRVEAEREAVGEEAMVLRCAAEATLEALTRLMGAPPRFALIGAKRMLAFDAAVLLACVRTLEGPPRKLIGCVPIQDDPVEAVAKAVLHATNRIVEAIPNAGPEDGPGTSDES